LARTGSTAGNGSGDIFVAFSTANPNAAEGQVNNVDMLNNNAMSPLFDAAVQATEEAIINALVAAQTMVGRDNNRVSAIPHERLKQVLKKYNRLAERDPA
ncbi:MAG TPA: P1 family peptidase, partial [Chloroflexia bacterium]|nr:P1 family peptidase [Chloroflexia bacterium]